MGDKLLLVGSIPYDTVDEVMRSFGAPLGAHLPALPDGEVGERRSWVNRLCYLVFNGHVGLETIRRPASVDGVEALLPRTRDEAWQFKVRPGFERIRFGHPGMRLGYARDAVASFFVFRTLREQGLLPADLRFQISIPMVNSVVRPLYFPEPGDVDRVRPGFEEALASELDVILARIPHQDLAIQWDCAWESQAVSGAAPTDSPEAVIATHIPPIRRLSARLPEAVELGFHFCFGTFGGWPAFAPETLSPVVDLANAAVEGALRRVDWIHIPILDRSDQVFYAPLAGLKPRGARIYLGAIHHMATLEARVDAARQFLPEFGLAAYCGFGRTSPLELPQILEDHLAAVKLVGAG